jgi:phosphoglycerol transferase MdoB-like AlkP superfamily enzyme
MVNFGIYAAYVLIGICIVGILGFSIMNLIKDPKAAKSALIGIIGLLVIFGLTFALSDGSEATTTFADEDISEGGLRRVGMGLGAFYVLTAAAILVIVYVEVSRLFSK